jgi:hypothetical protein
MNYVGFRKEPYDTVIGYFEDGCFVYDGACFREKTHIQIAVRNPKSIIGYCQLRGHEVFR